MLDLEKSIEQLENEYWPPLLGEESGLVGRCHALRSTKLKDFDIEDLRIMIGQNIGLAFLIPLAVKELNKNILAEGDYYEGDLLTVVLKSNQEFWRNEILLWNKVCSIFKENTLVLNKEETDSIRNGWLDSYRDYEKINSQ